MRSIYRWKSTGVTWMYMRNWHQNKIVELFICFSIAFTFQVMHLIFLFAAHDLRIQAFKVCFVFIVSRLNLILNCYRNKWAIVGVQNHRNSNWKQKSILNRELKLCELCCAHCIQCKMAFLRAPCGEMRWYIVGSQFSHLHAILMAKINFHSHFVFGSILSTLKMVFDCRCS